MKSTFERIITELLAASQTLLVRHPKRILAILALLLLSGTGVTYAVATLAPDASSLPIRRVVETLPLPNLPQQVDALEAQVQKLYRSELTRSTDTADTLLKRLGVFDPVAAAFLHANPLVQKNLLRHSGRTVRAETTSTNTLLKLQVRWSPNDDGTFHRLTIKKSGSGFTAHIDTLPLVASSRISSGSISTSLFAATDEARIPDAVANQLADIFSADIDFHRALKVGDRFSVVYETLEADGEPLRTGRVLSAEFVNAGKIYQAMWFQEPVANGFTPAKGGYYTLNGDSLRREFLASPVEFSRITSGFSMRFHPILQTWKAHLGVDYGAPIGTSVRTVGDGVVEFAGVQNGFGNVVKVMHQGQISTLYAHLNEIRVHSGQAVSQGQTIGLVGSTGWATGPHLHFEYRVNGEYRDPQTIAQTNATLPLNASMRPLFDKVAAQARVALAAASQLRFSTVE
ncbi:MAG: M23 family metallopeptidase [Rhodoferax sp.]|nr:M23 family metallopeptidase [Rhodoferax sp.]